MFHPIKKSCLVLVYLFSLIACKKDNTPAVPPPPPPDDPKDKIIGWWKAEKTYYGSYFASKEMYFGADNFYYINADNAGLGSSTGMWNWEDNNTLKVNCTTGSAGYTFFLDVSGLTSDSVMLSQNNEYYSAVYYKLDSAAITDKNELITVGGVIDGVILNGNIGDGGLVKDALFGYPTGLYLSRNGDLYVTDGSVIRKINASDSIITTVAGSVFYDGYLGDGGLAVDAWLDHPGEVAVDNNGNLLICDRDNNCIRKVAAGTNIISTIAGDNGPYGGGFSGDGGPAINARFNRPIAIALDAQENIYICDQSNNCIRKISSETGIITTVAGVGKPYEGGFDGDGGPAISAHLSMPVDIAFDPDGNLFIADVGNNRLRKVSANNGTITTVAGTGVIGSYDDGVLATKAPVSVFSFTIDASGNIYFVDGNRLRRIDKTNGKIYTLAGDGLVHTYPGEGTPATAFSLSGVLGIAVNKNGDIFFNDYERSQLRKVIVR